MTDTTIQTAGANAIWADPNQLVIGANVRRNVALDPDFVDSIREHGVLVPIAAWWDDIAGAWQVLDGQRRTLAAREAGRPIVPVWTVDPIAGEDQRITQQLTVNDRRKSLDDAEETAAVHDLALFGLTADTIRKKTSIPRARVDAALAVAETPYATELLEQQVTLEHAAAIAEFTDQPDLVEQLTQHAIDRPYYMTRAIQEARETAARRAAVAAARERLEADGWTVTDDYSKTVYDHRLAELVHEDGTPVTEDEALATGDAFVYVRAWLTGSANDEDRDPTSPDSFTIDTSIYIGDPTKHGFKGRFGNAVSTTTKPTKDERAAARERTKAWNHATEVRTAYLRAFLANKITSVRAGAVHALIATQLAGLFPRGTSAVNGYATRNLFTLPTEHGWQDTHGIARYLEINPTRALNVIAAMSLATIEEAIAQGNYAKALDHRSEALGRYLAALPSIGYVLTDLEQQIVEASLTSDEPDDDEQNEDDDPAIDDDQD